MEGEGGKQEEKYTGKMRSVKCARVDEDSVKTGCGKINTGFLPRVNSCRKIWIFHVIHHSGPVT